MGHPRPGSRRGTQQAFVCTLALLLLGGCAGLSQPTPALRLRWPEPPATPRIQLVQTISSPVDVAKPPSSWDVLVRLLLGSRSSGLRIAHPADIEVSASGDRVFISDFAQGVVHVYDLANGLTVCLGREAPFERPFGLALDSEGRLYVAEQAARQIRVVDEAGATLRTIRSDRLIRPADIEIDEERGLLYVADPSHQNSSEHYVRVFDLDGEYLGEVGEGRGVAAGRLLFPTYLALDRSGNLYVSDTMNSRVSVFDAARKFVRTIGGRGDGFGLFDKPKGLAFDAFDNLYVADSSWSNVQIFGPEDDVLLYFGGRGGYPGLLRNPTGLAISRSSNTIFVGDYLNRRIGVYRLVNTAAGDGVPAERNGEGTE